jgi:hypothetical protein
MTVPDGSTPSAPDVDQPDGGAHDGVAEQDTCRTPDQPDNDTTEDDTHAGS